MSHSCVEGNVYLRALKFQTGSSAQASSSSSSPSSSLSSLSFSFSNAGYNIGKKLMKNNIGSQWGWFGPTITNKMWSNNNKKEVSIFLFLVNI